MKKTTLILLVFSALLFTACKKMPELKVEKVDFSNPNVAYSQTSSEITFDYGYITNLQYVNVILSQSNYFGYSIVAQAHLEDSTVIANFVDLQTEKTYYYKYEYSNGINTMESEVFSFYMDPAQVTLPTIVTKPASEIAEESAVGGGNVIDDGGYNVTVRGICWSTHRNPTIYDNYTTDLIGQLGDFNATMEGLQPGTTYYVRAYAKNERGTGYGSEVTFTTEGGGGGGGGGGGHTSNRLFSISATQKVYFASGNLQYQASTNTWRFAENPWDYVGTTETEYGETGGTVPGSSNHLISPTYDGWIDLFGWGTGNNPTITSNDHNDYLEFIDWGTNTISNASGSWRTLTKDEWIYVIRGRNYGSGFPNYTFAVLNGIYGVLLLPDDWSTDVYTLVSASAGYAEDNTISVADWNNILEPAGVVFFPTWTGKRIGTSVRFVNDHSEYWSSSTYSETSWSAYTIFMNTGSAPSDQNPYRSEGHAVRLVKDAN